jgi:hypothetical protein
MSTFDWVAAGASSAAVIGVLLAAALARILGQIAGCATDLTEEYWASAPLTRATEGATEGRAADLVTHIFSGSHSRRRS